MNYIQKLLILIVVICTFSACKNDLQVNAPWKETTVVYGLLNPADSAQYIKINKAFLGPGNELSYAKIADSINYPNILNVTIQRYMNGSPYGNPVKLIRDSSIVKDPGTFANVPNILYRWDTPLNDPQKAVDVNSQYQLTIVNSQTGKTITGFTSVVGNIIPSLTPTIPFSSKTIALTNLTNGVNSQIKVGWGTAPSGKVYNLVIRIRYHENNVPKYIDWNFGNMNSVDTMGAINNTGDDMFQYFQGDAFYQFLGNQLSPMPANSRTFDSLDFIWNIGTLDLYTYIEVTTPSIGIVQEKPQFTDLNGGIGIFTSRATFTIPRCTLNYNSLDTLAFGIYTSGLGFHH